MQILGIFREMRGFLLAQMWGKEEQMKKKKTKPSKDFSTLADAVADIREFKYGCILDADCQKLMDRAEGNLRQLSEDLRRVGL